MRKKGNLIVISGPSGSGKGTICRALFQEVPDLHFSVSATTRKPRHGEKDGVHYFFLTKPAFENMITGDELLEWADVYGNYYGTPTEPLMKALETGRDVMLEIDVQGAFQVRNKYPGCVLIFLIPPSRAALEHRLRNRGTDSDDDIEQRLRWAEKEIGEVVNYDYVVINGEVEKATRDVYAVIKAERCRPALLDIESLLHKYR